MASRAVIFTALLICVFEYRQALATCPNLTSFSSQLDLWLAEYDREELPPGPVMVRAALDVQHATIDDKYASVRMLGALHLKWEDKRLSWNASSWGCRTAVTAAERLWLPDVSALNAVSRGNAAGVGLRARLFSDGRVAWVLRFDLTSPLSLALRAWPNDVQRAIFKFGSRVYGTAYNLTIDDFVHATVFESSSWELVKVTTTVVNYTDEARDVAAWTLILRRRAAAHSLAAGAVLTAAVLLLIAAALLPPTTRPALCAIAAFTVALWLISALVRLPGAAEAPRAMALLCAVCVCGAGAAAGAALVLRVAGCASPPPAALRSLVTATSAFCKLTPPDGSEAEWSAWAAAAQLFDRILLAAMLLTLFIIVCLYVALV